RLAETLAEFRGRLRARAETLDIVERQRILRLVVQEILVGSDTIRIRHSIPVVNSGTGGSTSPGSPICPGTGTGFGSYLLRMGSPKEASPLFLSGRSHPSFAKEGSSPAAGITCVRASG